MMIMIVDQDAFVMWTMHPCERDARLAKKAIKKGPEAYSVLIEIACSRSSDELLGARRAYHSLFDHSIEEDVAHYVKGPQRKVTNQLPPSHRGPARGSYDSCRSCNTCCATRSGSQIFFYIFLRKYSGLSNLFFYILKKLI